MSTSAEKIKMLAMPLTTVGMFIAIAGLAYLFLMPKSYRAEAMIKIIDWVHASDLNHPSDLQLISNQCDWMRSETFLDQVIKNLGLAGQWSQRYHTADDTSANRARLLSKVSIFPVPDSTLVKIRVISDDREETARIANEFARIYTNRISLQREALINDKLGGLKQQWTSESEKIQTAQVALDHLYFDISKTRLTNKTQFYDGDTYDEMKSKKIQMEGEYIERKNEYERLSKLPTNQLAQVLSSMDTNSPLNTPMLELANARNQSLKANLDQGPDSREVKNAALLIGNLNRKIDEMASSVMTVKQTELRGLSSAIEELKQKIQNGSTNVASVKLDNANYQAALSNLNQLEEDRNNLETKMREVESAEATRPTGITAELIERAEVPVKPFAPDSFAAAIIIGTGAIATVLGLLLWIIGVQSAALAKEPTR
ncbi:MAG TPA: hypothetical protein VH413_17930 [Verrucomicrobiae bacterium]|jgi:uncharacterized protein involved in exopolysaccharide biosynthesis|nr:hypothetical protein [Verrucomicrobiae bacterium]